MKKTRILLSIFALVLLGTPVIASKFFDLPPLPEPWQYGNVLIERQADASDQLPVSFSHWSHRLYYTCRVCHFELDFVMETNATEITEKSNQKGEYCGACHNDEIAFGHTDEHCTKCHNGGRDGSKQLFRQLRLMPKAPFGNKIDWDMAVKYRLIRPKQSILEEDYEPVEFSKKFELAAEWALIPPAHFSHDKHQEWLDCGDCHPGLFNVEKKTTEHFEMRYILEGKFCGACHLKVAFPLDDCKACHPGMH